MPKLDVQKIASSRYHEDYILDERDKRGESFQDWKSRIGTLDDAYRGNWSVAFPGESSTTAQNVANIIQVGLDDISRLVCEAVPSVQCDPYDNTQREKEASQLRAQVAEAYWLADDAELIIPLLALDLAGTGACFLLSFGDREKSNYPVHLRLDPRACYPDITGRDLQDLLVVHKMKKRQALRMWPDIGLKSTAQDDGDVEVIEYWAPDQWVKCIKSGDKGVIVKAVDNPLGRVPVSWAKLPSFDGAFRGIFDQVLGPLKAKNRFMTNVLEYFDQAIWGAIYEFDTQNPQDYGPGAIIRGQTEKAQFLRIPPAEVNPQVFGLASMLEEEARRGAAYPAQRQGEVSQSIASAAYVASTQGQLTTVVRDIQRHLSDVRRQQTMIDFAIDEFYLDFDKPVLGTASKKSYLPSRDLKGKHSVRVVYGAGAGIDALNRGVMVKQDLGAGLISRETAREQTDYILQPLEEEQRRIKEQVQDVFMQKILSDPGFPVAQLYQLMHEQGMDLLKAGAQIEQERAAQMAAMQQQAPGMPALPAGAAPAGPEQAEQAQRALQKGGIPGQAPELQEAFEPEFARPPLSQIFITTP
jgi:hypothetical protein